MLDLPVARSSVRTPLIGFAFTALFGVLLALKWGDAPPVVLLVLGGIWLGGLLSVRPLPTVLAIHLLGLGVFFLHGWLTVSSPSPRELGNMIQREREFVVIAGTVNAEPQVYRAADGSTGQALVPIRAQAMKRSEGWEYARGKVLAVVSDPDEQTLPVYGQQVVLKGNLEHRTGPGLGLAKTTYRLQAAPGNIAGLDTFTRNPVLARCFQGRKFLAGVLGRGMEDFPTPVAVAQALLLGYRSEIPRELMEQFAHTGTLHIFALSGLHVGVVSLLVIVLIRACGVTRNRWILVLLPVLVVFVLSTGMKASAVRAGIMAVLYWAAPFFHRRPHGPTALAAAVLLILLVSPLQLEDTGFIYSFAIVFGLLGLVPLIMRALERLLPRREEWAPAGETPFSYRLWMQLHPATSLFAISLAAWLISMPMNAYFFNTFSPVALLGNLVVVPAAFLIIATGALSLVFGSLVPFLAEVFNHANRLIISLLLDFTGLAQSLPGSHQFVRSPPLVWVGLYYAGLLGLMVRRKFTPGLAAYLLVLGVGWAGMLWQQHQAVTLDIISLPRGQAALLQARGTASLIDAGPAYYARHIQRHLQQEGVDRLDRVILSHADAAHVGGLIPLLASYAPPEVWMPGVYGRSPVFERVRQALDERAIVTRALRAGDHGEWDNGVVWEVFYPHPDLTFTRADQASLVLRLARGGQAVLMMGGAESSVEQVLLARPLDPFAPVLVLASTFDPDMASDDWLKVVGARELIMPRRAGRDRGQVARDMLERLERRGVTIHRMDDPGSVRIDLRSGRVTRLGE